MIFVSFNKENIIYSVGKLTHVSETFKPLLERLSQARTKTPGTIICCLSYNMCGDLYLHFSKSLDHKLTEPVNALSIPMFHMVDMFTSVTDYHHKDVIVPLFTNASHRY